MTDLERAELACRRVADKIRGNLPDIAEAFDRLADELEQEQESLRQEQDEDPEYTKAGVFGESE